MYERMYEGSSNINRTGLLGPLSVDRTCKKCLAPGQDYRQGVAVPPNAFPPMFMLYSGGVGMCVVVEDTDTSD
jgi:hypothetical protein